MLRVIPQKIDSVVHKQVPVSPDSLAPCSGKTHKHIARCAGPGSRIMESPISRTGELVPETASSAGLTTVVTARNPAPHKETKDFTMTGFFSSFQIKKL